LPKPGGITPRKIKVKNRVLRDKVQENGYAFESTLRAAIGHKGSRMDVKRASLGENFPSAFTFKTYNCPAMANIDDGSGNPVAGRHKATLQIRAPHVTDRGKPSTGPKPKDMPVWHV